MGFKYLNIWREKICLEFYRLIYVGGGMYIPGGCYIHELSFNMNFYEMSSWNVINRAFSKLYNVSRMSFIKVYVKLF